MRSEAGKPYLDRNVGLFFSISHTKEKLFIDVSDENVGIDAEKNDRSVEYASIVKRFSAAERLEICDNATFLKHWTAKESAVKWLGGSLSHDLRKLRYEKGVLIYGEIELPANVCFFQIDGHTVCVCGEQDFSNAEQIEFY